MTSELSDAAAAQVIDAECYVSKQQTSPVTTHHVDYDEQHQVAPAVNGTSTPPADAGGLAQSGSGVYNGIEDGVAEDRVADEVQPPPGQEIDDEGYRVEHRFETESVSRCKEVKYTHRLLKWVPVRHSQRRN